MIGLTDVSGGVTSGYTATPAVTAGDVTTTATTQTQTQTLHMNPQGASEPMGDVRMTPPALRQGNPYGVGVNIDYMA
ncbi:MAG: hypothetical protein QGH40_15150 [bacterium]|nr:hypothetical protein [bacterium]